MSAKKTNENNQRAEELEKEQAAKENETAGSEPKEAGQKQPAQNEAETLSQQLAQSNDKLLRTLAEYDNYRKRSQKERAEIYPDAVAATVTKLLPVLDNFERALQTDCADAEFKKGVEMIFTSFTETLKALGVEEIEAQGKEFDPNLHNAVMHVDDEAIGENMVAQVMQKGYKLGERVLRHAMVSVAN